MPGATRYVEVPPELTQPTPKPRPPAPLCLDPYDAPVLCAPQLALWVISLEAALEQSNTDKAAIATLGEPDGR